MDKRKSVADCYNCARLGDSKGTCGWCYSSSNLPLWKPRRSCSTCIFNLGESEECKSCSSFSSRPNWELRGGFITKKEIPNELSG